MSFKSISLEDRKTFEKYLEYGCRELSVYAFENIYIWKALFEVKWAIIESSLCIFFKDETGAFLYLPPLGKKKSPAVLDAAFKEMDRVNENRDISRIENIPEADLGFYKSLGLDCYLKSHDYLCLQTELSRLKGNKFKSQRANYNYFVKHNSFTPSALKEEDFQDCLKLYGFWMGQRTKINRDPVYTGLMQDSLKALKAALESYSRLAFQGIAVRVNGELRGFTFGFKLDKEAFCILYEITDLSFKGLAQFIFAEFSRRLENYKYINIMDDSGLDNLRETKLLYHPVKLCPSYVARR